MIHILLYNNMGVKFVLQLYEFDKLVWKWVLVILLLTMVWLKIFL